MKQMEKSPQTLKHGTLKIGEHSNCLSWLNELHCGKFESNSSQNSFSSIKSIFCSSLKMGKNCQRKKNISEAILKLVLETVIYIFDS